MEILKSLKAVLALVGGIITAVLAVIDDAAIDANEIGAFAAAVVSAVVVWFARNRTSAPSGR